MAALRSMVSVAEARERAQKRVEQDQREWAATGLNDDVVLEIVLRPPTESVARADHSSAFEWVSAWRALDKADPSAEVVWGERQWPSIGTQSVPERCVLRGADAIAAFAGGTLGREWRTLRARAAHLRGVFGPAPVEPLAAAIRTHGRTLRLLSEADFVTLIDVVIWLAEHPVSGWRVRQLPIRGIDTKWLEGHRSIVEALHAAVSGRESIGLLGTPNRVRVRFLDPALQPGGLCDVSAPVEELAALPMAPSIVFVFENLETMFSMPDWPGAVVVHGSGYAVGRLHQFPWARSAQLIYWGDLDSDGFAILHTLRSGRAEVMSVLMDEETLLAYRDLWVTESKPAVGTYPTLTAEEQRALDRIRSEGNVRLEQERIPWGVALATLLTAVSGCARSVSLDVTPPIV